MRSVFLELRLKELVLMIGYRFLVQDEDIRYIIIMDLRRLLVCHIYIEKLQCPDLFFKVFENLCPVTFDEVQLP